MGVNVSSTNTSGNMPLNFISVIKNIFLTYLLTLIFLLLFAFVITYTDFPESFVPAIVLVITCLSIILAGILTARSSSAKGFLSGMVAGSLYMITLFCIGSIVFQTFNFGLNFITMLLLGVFCGTFGGIIGINLKKR